MRSQHKRLLNVGLRDRKQYVCGYPPAQFLRHQRTAAMPLPPYIHRSEEFQIHTKTPWLVPLNAKKGMLKPGLTVLKSPPGATRLFLLKCHSREKGMLRRNGRNWQLGRG